MPKVRKVPNREFICPRCYTNVKIDPRIVFDAYKNEHEGWVCDACKKEICLKPF